jgi:hypothetical protein
MFFVLDGERGKVDDMNVSLVSTVATVLAVSIATAAQPPGSATPCTAAAPAVRVAELPEGSGLAASRLIPGRFWSHNDSGLPVLFALDAGGAVTGRLQLSGAAVEDWEAIAVGPCPAGDCIYVADIGDNQAKRKSITIYRVPEPVEVKGVAQVESVFHASYPDGPHDAEALLITPDGRLHIVTKGDAGPVAVYRFPAELRAGSTMHLERLGGPRDSKLPGARDRVTDGAVSRDGQLAVLRTVDSLTFYRTEDLLSGQWRETGRAALASLAEPQGEGVSFGPDNTVFLIGEGGGKKMPGTFARLTCNSALK